MSTGSTFKRTMGIAVCLFGGALIWTAKDWPQKVLGAGFLVVGLFLVLPDEMRVASGYLVSLLRNLGVIPKKPERKSGEKHAHSLTISEPIDAPSLPPPKHRKHTHTGGEDR